MRYISDDGRVFNTEQECYEHEQKVKIKKEEERIQREKIESECKQMIEEIQQKRKELKKLTENYQGKFGTLINESFSLGELLKILKMLY